MTFLKWFEVSYQFPQCTDLYTLRTHLIYKCVNEIKQLVNEATS